MMKVSFNGWRERFAKSYLGWVIASFFMLVLNWLLDIVLQRDVVPLTPDLLYIIPIACLFGGLFFASIFSLFPGSLNDD